MSMPSTVSAVWAETRVFTRRQLEHIRQIPEKLLDVTIQPLMFVLLFAYVFGGAIDVGRGGSYREYLIGGILVQSLTFGMMGPATSIATDLQEGVIDRFRTLPVSRYSYLAGHFLAELMGILFSVVVLLGTGLIVGWRAHTLGGTVHAIALLVVFASCMIWAGTWLGMLVRSPDAVMGIGFTVVFPITFLSNAFVPIASMPSALQWVATYNPVSILVQAVRELFGNPLAPVLKHAWPIDHPVAASWIAVAALAVIVVPGAFHRFRIRTTE